MVLHDEKRIQQVLLNLQSNALKFTETGSVVIKAEIKKQDEDEYLKLSVEDTGYGIKPEEKDKLFKLFGYVNNAELKVFHNLSNTRYRKTCCMQWWKNMMIYERLIF